MVVINADDLALSSEVNAAVFESFDRGWITTATVMTNMPGFEEALDLIAARGLEGRIGVHLNLTEGEPLTEPIRRSRAFCGPDGRYLPEGPARWLLGTFERDAVREELRAQIEALVSRGLRPSHLDSHHHVHTHWPIGTIVIRLALELGIPAVRISRNCGDRPAPLVQVYKSAFNRRLARAGLARIRHFGADPDLRTVDRFRGPVEVMVHPAMGDDLRIVDRIIGGPDLAEIAARWRDHGTLASYAELCLERRSMAHALTAAPTVAYSSGTLSARVLINGESGTGPPNLPGWSQVTASAPAAQEGTALATATATTLRPLGDRVVVQPTAREEMTKSGIVLPDTAKEKPQEGTIIAAGPGRLNDEGQREPMDVKVGDKVLYAKYAGTEFKVDDEEYLIVSQKDILAVVEG
jgi:predicted glycoside hydrolase/deacetylase ChbG (UPF0249 family)/co-chaperonin GroES (HSP10)